MTGSLFEDSDFDSALPDKPLQRCLAPIPDFSRINTELVSHAVGLRLNPEIELVFAHVYAQKKGIFVHGSGGTGKSAIISVIKKLCPPEQLKVIAFTGVAALNAGGRTLHDVFRLGHNRNNISAEAAKELRALRYLIIDEISMVRPDYLDEVSDILQNIHGNSEPFGGITVVMLGDPYQLPPVITKEERPTLAKSYGSNTHFFAARSFQQLMANEDFASVRLIENFRATDPEFQHQLESIRCGTIDQFNEACRYFNERCYEGGELLEHAVGIAFHRQDVDARNHAKIEELKLVASRTNLFDELVSFAATYEGNCLTSDFICNKEFIPRVGMHVQLLNNDSRRRWVNGSMGQITAINSSSVEVLLSNKSKDRCVVVSPHCFVKRENRRVVGTCTQLPMVPAYWITAFKAQGMTSAVNIYPTYSHYRERLLPRAALYVMLSRAPCVKDIRLAQRISPQDFMRDDDLEKFLSSLRC